jgi:hypothetical protein
MDYEKTVALYEKAGLLKKWNTPFDELFEWASTSTYRLDRAYKDQLEASHIG